MSKNRSELLKDEIKRLKKINESLIKRVESGSRFGKDAFSLFEKDLLFDSQLRDRTKRLELRNSRALAKIIRMNNLLNALPGVVLIYNKDFDLEEVLAGCHSEIKGFPVDNLLASEYSLLNNKIQDAVLELGKDSPSVSFEYLHTTEEGLEYFYYCAISIVDNKRYLFYVQENTESYLLRQKIHDQEIQLVQALRLSSLGEMAGGVAHEINTPLGAILLSANLMSNKVDDIFEDDIREFFKKRLSLIENTVERISSIVTSLKLLSRSEGLIKTKDCAVSSIFTDALNLCRDKIKAHGVNLEVEIPEDSSVHADHVQISQVILNLLNNSFHVARNQEGGWIKLLCERVNGSCRISVIDCGQGVADEVLKKIFDPFFTTKDVGEGTGLGMSISQRLLELHGSEIKYKLTDGHTTFYFELECKCAKQVA